MTTATPVKKARSGQKHHEHCPWKDRNHSGDCPRIRPVGTKAES